MSINPSAASNGGDFTLRGDISSLCGGHKEGMNPSGDIREPCGCVIRVSGNHACKSGEEDGECAPPKAQSVPKPGMWARRSSQCRIQLASVTMMR